MKIYFPFRWIGVARATVAFHTVNVKYMLRYAIFHAQPAYRQYIYLLAIFIARRKSFPVIAEKEKHVAVNVAGDVVVLANSAFGCT